MSEEKAGWWNRKEVEDGVILGGRLIKVVWRRDEEIERFDEDGDVVEEVWLKVREKVKGEEGGERDLCEEKRKLKKRLCIIVREERIKY